MTIEEKIAELRESIEGCGFQCHRETYEAALTALEKQIPKKPVWNTESDKRYSVERCPVCRAIVANGEFHDDYCYKCGQAIDWGE